MQKAVFLLFLATWISLGASAQKRSLLSRPYQPQLQVAPVDHFLREMNERSGIRIEYATNSLDTSKAVRITGKESTIGAVLATILAGQHVKLIERNHKLLLVRSASPINIAALVPSHNLYGIVKEEHSQEPLIGATIFEAATGRAVISNPYGYYSLNLPEGQHRLEITYVGYQPKAITVDMRVDARADVSLTLKTETAVMQEIVLPATGLAVRNGGDLVSSGGHDQFNYLLGENDPLRSAYLLPGVQHIPSAFGGMMVRGGSGDENLFLMDGNVVYHPTHMLGALSIINQTSLKSMRLYKSDFPSRFGDATSSVVDVYTKDGHMEKWQGEANIGTLAGALTLEGPLAKNKTSFMGSFRHSYTGPLLNPFQNGIKPNFFDAHLKVTQLLGKRNKIMANFYNGRDEVRQTTGQTDNLHRWGNLAGSLGWNLLVGSKSFINTSVNISRYKNLGGFEYTLLDDIDDDDEDEEVETGSVGTLSATEQWNASSNAEIHLSPKAKINAGIKFAHTTIQPFQTKFSDVLDDDEATFTSFSPLPFDELAVYVETEVKLANRLFIRPGLHASAYEFRQDRFYSVEPRFFLFYRIGTGQQLSASYSQMTQFLHLLTNPYLGINADTWVPSTNKLRPKRSVSYNLGYHWKRNGYQLSLETYYKELDHVTNYAEGTSFFVNNDSWEENVSTGDGQAYGAEFLARKTAGQFTFHGSYTLAWSWRQFDDLNHGQRFPFKYDRRHSANLGLGYEILKGLDVSALWTFATGDAFSLPDQVYPDFDQSQQVKSPDDPLRDFRFVYYFTQGNQNRTEAYQRLDAGLRYRTNGIKNIKLTISAGVYNIFGSPDQYIYDLKGSLKTPAVIVRNASSTFNTTPYVSVNIEF